MTELEDIVMNRIVDMGGRNLSEPSLKCVSSFLMLLTNSDAAALPAVAKQSYYQKVKREFRKKVRKAVLVDALNHDINLPGFPLRWKTEIGRAHV